MAAAVWNCVRIIVIVVLVSPTRGCERPSFVNTSVTIVGVRGVDAISGCLEPIGALEKASYVQILNQSIPALYRDAVHDMPNLADLILDDNGIALIEPGAFRNLSKLRLLRLKNNVLTAIESGVFSGLLLTELNLMNNSIARIAVNAFDGMPNLAVLTLDQNKIAQWNSGWFANSPNINTLSLKSNLLEYIPARAFQNIYGMHQVAGRNVTTNIYFNDNRIAHVDSRSLEGLTQIGWLFLPRNQISDIDENWLDPVVQIDWLKLSHNRLTCVPEKMLQKIPAVSRYLDGNPLSNDCRERLSRI